MHQKSPEENREGHESTISMVAASDPSQTDNLHKAVAETAGMKAAGLDPVVWDQANREKAERDRFRPFIHVVGTETVPSQITAFAMTGGHKRWHTIQIPEEVLELPLEEQLQKVPALMAAYKREHNGLCPFFGKVAGFQFVRWSDYFKFDADGRLIERVEKPFHRGVAWAEFR